mmetsp:Transcript_3742/g.11071  ORF Transcript_3742/g.11071 Transcript_3742/m.11071 type:complete len:232 (-) Transcript_3742:1076-1771(-)
MRRGPALRLPRPRPPGLREPPPGQGRDGVRRRGALRLRRLLRHRRLLRRGARGHVLGRRRRRRRGRVLRGRLLRLRGQGGRGLRRRLVVGRAGARRPRRPGGRRRGPGAGRVHLPRGEPGVLPGDVRRDGVEGVRGEGPVPHGALRLGLERLGLRGLLGAQARRRRRGRGGHAGGHAGRRAGGPGPGVPPGPRLLHGDAAVGLVVRGGVVGPGQGGRGPRGAGRRAGAVRL